MIKYTVYIYASKVLNSFWIMIKKNVSRCREAFREGRTRSIEFRRRQLLALREFLIVEKDDLVNAIYEDIKKPKDEFLLIEYYFCINEVNIHLNNLNNWTKPKHVSKTLITMLDSAYVKPQPMGTVLIISPWNYPINLTISPLVGAISAGNTAILKPSELSPATSSLLANKLPCYLDQDCYQVIEGAVEETTQLLAEKFDLIMYTGSSSVARIVMQAAAKHLTPCLLELGGKCPVYVSDDSDMYIVARRICWGKCINQGQTCLAPDYILCSNDTKVKLVEMIKKVLFDFYGENPEEPNKCSRIINKRHFNRLVNLIRGTNILIGDVSQIDEQNLYIPQIVVDNVSRDHPVMQEEIFGPIMPIIRADSPSDAINFINQGHRPLAIYVFSKNRSVQRGFIEETCSGGVTCNDILMHSSIVSLPFGGVGESGMGVYHGEHSFKSFSHMKSVLECDQILEKILDVRCPPYGNTKTALGSWLTVEKLSQTGLTGRTSILYTCLLPVVLFASAVMFFLKLINVNFLIPDKLKSYFN